MKTKTISAIVVAILLAYGGYEWYGGEEPIYPGAPGDTWCASGWNKRIDINVNNTVGSALTDYQILVNLSSNPINETSLVVYNSSGCTLRPHWCENITDGNCTKLWIKYSAIGASAWTNNTAIYYENATASSTSNGADTFELFDDFDDNSTIATDQTTKDTVLNTTKYSAWSYIIKLHDGTLFVVYSEGDAHGCPNNHDVKCINSTNNGSTWSTPQTITAHPDASTDARNPSVLEFNDSGTWTILVYYDIQTAAIGNAVCKKSTDGGQTWSSEINITTNNDRYIWGTGIEMSNGSLLVGTYAYSPGTGCYAHISSDGGDNWTEYTISTTSGMSEVSFIEKTTNGHILAIIRNYADAKTYNSTSTNYGQTWGTPVDMSLTASDSPVALLRLNDGDMLMSWEQSDSDFRVARSSDEGATWNTASSYSVYYDASMPANAGYVSSVEISSNQLYSLFYVQKSAADADIHGNDVNISASVGQWVVDRGDWTISNSELVLDSVDTLRNPVLRPKPLIWRSRIHFATTTDYMMFGMCEEPADEWGSIPDGDSIFYQALITGKDYPTSYNNGTLTQNTSHTGSSGYHIYGIKWKTNEIKYILDDSVIDTFTTNVPDEPIWAKFDHRTGTHKVDWIMIAKYASPEPSTSLCSEEQYSATTPVISNVTNGSISATSQWIKWEINQTAHNRVVYDNGSVSAGSTACEGQWSATHACANASDGNWSSYAESAGALTSYAYFNYTVPTGASQVESLWHVKDAIGHANLTVPSACWGGTLYLRARCSDVANSVLWQCDNGPGWTTMHTSVANIAYEHEMKFKYTSSWDNSTAAPNITLSGLIGSTLYEYQAWSYNTSNISLSDNSSTLNFTTAAAESTPVISNVINGSISHTSQYIDWDVNQTAHNRVLYSNESDLTPAYYSTWDNSTAAPNITLSGLTASTKYYYQAWSHNTTNTSLSDNSSTLNFTTAAAANYITITGGNRALFCNWSSNTTFANIAANLTNCTDFFAYNSTSQRWTFYNVNRTVNANTFIHKHAAIFVCFNNTTTVECDIISAETITIPSNVWYYTALRESASKTLTEINTAIAADGCTISDLYTWNSTAGAYTNTGSYNVLPNEGFAIYCSIGCNWDGGI